jgi:phosphatidylglycerophosphatase A
MTTADRLRQFLITGGGLGYAPVASGTFGTLGGIALALALQAFLDGPALIAGFWILAAALLAFGCSTSGYVARTFPYEDPKPFVLDEIVGYLVTLGVACWFVGEPTALVHGIAFFVFRATDVLKLPPARQLEYLPGAAGIMLDDVAAGVQAGLLIALLSLTGVEF